MRRYIEPPITTTEKPMPKFYLIINYAALLAMAALLAKLIYDQALLW